MKGIIKGAIRGQEGNVLILVLILLVVGGLILAPLLGLMSTGLLAGQVYEKKTDELYAADAGVEDAIWRITNNLTFGTNNWSEPWSLAVNGKNVTVQVYREDLDPTCGENFTYQILSTAVTDDGGGTAAIGSTTTVESYIQFESGNSSGGGSPIFGYALASLDGDIELTGGSDVGSDVALEGDIYANGDIILSGGSIVDGDATATGTINGGIINGNSTEGADPLEPPEIDPLVAECYQETQGGCALCGPITRPGDWTPSPGTYNAEHIEGKLDIKNDGTYTFNGPVCVDGDAIIEIDGTVTFNGPVCVQGYLLIKDKSTVLFGDTVYVGGYLKLSTADVHVEIEDYVSVDGELILDGGVQLWGGQTVVVQGQINLSGGSDLLNPPDADDLPFLISLATGKDAITTGGQGYVMAVLYAPYGPIEFSGGSSLYGCAVGQSILIGGEGQVVYPIDLRERGDLPGAGEGDDGEKTVNIISWEIK